MTDSGEMNKNVMYLTDDPEWSKEDKEFSGFSKEGWYYWDETGAYCTGPFITKEDALRAFDYYVKYVL